MSTKFMNQYMKIQEKRHEEYISTMHIIKFIWVNRRNEIEIVKEIKNNAEDSNIKQNNEA